MNQVLFKNKIERTESKNVPDCYSIPTTKYVCEIGQKDLIKLMNGSKRNKSFWFMEAGKRDIEYLKKTYQTLTVLATENL